MCLVIKLICLCTYLKSCYFSEYQLENVEWRIWDGDLNLNSTLISQEPVSPGSAVMCRPISRNGSWRQIGLTSLKALATIVSPHFSWILSTSSKAGHPLSHELMPWMEKPKSSSLIKQPATLPFYSIIIVILQKLS